ncbi:hypothetical protein [Singulisphaera sp. PoT]|uniref:hypothetical protein n=1 Tax=Singulisphaera sp. PoT TaxID=3411797 RepID=UPI003BF45ED3
MSEKERSVEELRAAGWMTAEDLANAGYDRRSEKDSESAAIRIERTMSEYHDELIKRMFFALHLSENKVLKGQWERHGELMDEVMVSTADRLIQIPVASPIAVELMKLEGYIEQREKSTEITAAGEAGQATPSSLKGVASQGKGVDEKKGGPRK